MARQGCLTIRLLGGPAKQDLRGNIGSGGRSPGWARRLRLGLTGVCALAALTGTALAEPLSGRYGPLVLAARDGTVHGVFSEGRLGNGTDEAPQFTCLFLLEGRLENGRAKVFTWFPGEAERIEGTLDLGSDPALRLTENHGGCSMTSGEMSAEPYALSLDEAHPEWIGAGLVTAERAVLRRKPEADARQTRPYLVKFDAFAVLERRDGWLRIAFVETDGPPVTGWVRGEDVSVTVAEGP